jgi:hypothetical protein
VSFCGQADEVMLNGPHRIEVRGSKGDPDEAVLEIKYRKIQILAPIGKRLRLIRARERNAV